MLAEPAPPAPQSPPRPPHPPRRVGASAPPRERPFPTFQGFLQGLGEAGRTVAIAVVPAWILPRGEGRGRQVKVHEGQVMTSHLDGRRQSNRDGLRGFCPGFHYHRLAEVSCTTWAAGGQAGAL